MHGLTVFLLALALGLYLLGLRRFWARAGTGRGIALGNAACFLAGWTTLAAALLSPLHHAAERLLWAHMVQHELLMVVAAPLIVLGRPLEAFSRVAAFRVPKILADPLFAWALHAAALWAWHAPALFEAAASDPWAHLAQHASFFLPAAAFWWTVLAAGARPLPALVSALTTMMHTGALGALMTFSRAPWYAGFGLEDQQLAGLVMWVPAGLVYPLAALYVLSRSLRRYSA